MKSKVANYVEGQNEFLNRASDFENGVYSSARARKEIHDIDEKLLRYDASDKDAVVNGMKQLMTSEESKSDEALAAEADAQVNEAKGNVKIQTNFKDASLWLGNRRAQEILHKKPIAYGQGIDIARAENPGGMQGLTKADNALGKVFRASFLGSLAKPLQVIIGVVAWGIVLVALLNLPLIALLVVAANIVVFALANSATSKYIRDNQLTLLALFEPEKTKTSYSQYKIERFDQEVLAPWRKELDDVEKGGLSAANSAPGTLFSRVRDEYAKKTKELSDAKKEAEALLEQVESHQRELLDEINASAEELRAQESELQSLVREDNLNEGVLTPWVSYGLTAGSFFGVRQLCSIKHDCKPVFILYGDDLYKDIESFKVAASDIIESLMLGFLRENSLNNVNLTLVDMIGMHFPEERTQGLLNVITKRQDIQVLYDNLGSIRSSIKGRIEDANPKSLACRENPVPYNIVFFAGVDFSSIDNEVSQLFVSGRDFGFMPIILLSESDSDSILSAQQSKSTFPGLLNSAYEDGRVNSFVEMYIAPSSGKSLYLQAYDDEKPIGDGTGFLVSDRFETMGPKVNAMLGMSSEFFVNDDVIQAIASSGAEWVDDEECVAAIEKMLPLYIDCSCSKDDEFYSVLSSFKGCVVLACFTSSAEGRQKASKVKDRIIEVALEGEEIPLRVDDDDQPESIEALRQEKEESVVRV